MNRAFIAAGLLLAALVVACGDDNGNDTPPSVSVSPAVSSSLAPTLTLGATPGPTATPSPSPAATQPPQSDVPPTGSVAQVIRYGDASRKVVALTFDAGSDVGYTAMILDVLSASGVRSNFRDDGKVGRDEPRPAAA